MFVLSTYEHMVGCLHCYINKNNVQRIKVAAAEYANFSNNKS